MNWKARLLYPQNWNIGFVEQSLENLLDKQQLGRIKWMKHNYKDRWFADPFIYEVTDDEIVVFVEECQITDEPKGILCELHVDRKTMRLRKRHVLLELDTHLSYPAIIEKDGETYVYPENGASGSLKMYKFDGHNHRLVEPVCILNDAVADSTILFTNNTYYIVATKSKNSKENAYLYQSKDLFGESKLVTDLPVQTNRSCSRPAGNWISLSGKLYRPSQDCSKRYGGAMNIMLVDSLIPFHEEISFNIMPTSYKYHFGTHTINFSKDASLTVIDGYGYLHPLIGRIWDKMASVKNRILNKER